jgi:hypothetical protein
MGIAIGINDNEKTFESIERPERFSLETKGREIYFMKPTTLTNNKDARKFPFVEYQYQSSSLEDLNSRCAKLSNSFRDISRDYFETEENQDFLSNAAIFLALIASALVPIAASASEMIHLVRVLPTL